MKARSRNRFLTYINERAPLTQFVPLALIFGFQASLFARFIIDREYDLTVTLLSSLSLLLFLFRLRLFDEFKDFEHDKKHYPSRPISRGLLSLNDLKPLIVIILTLEICLSLLFGIASFIFFLLAFLYSAFLLKEFFIRKWLRKHFTTYIVTHEVLAIFIFYYLYALNVSEFFSLGKYVFFLHVIFLSLSFFSLEVARKIRPRSREIPSKDTYTAQYGIAGASVLLGFLCVASLLLSFVIFQASKPLPFFVHIPGAIGLILLLGALMRFSSRATTKHAKQVFFSAILYTVLLHIGVIAGLWLEK